MSAAPNPLKFHYIKSWGHHKIANQKLTETFCIFYIVLKFEAVLISAKYGYVHGECNEERWTPMMIMAKCHVTI